MFVVCVCVRAGVRPMIGVTTEARRETMSVRVMDVLLVYVVLK